MSDGVDTSKDAILGWCRAYVADLLGVSVERVDPKADFDHLGIDSQCAVSLLMEIDDRYGVDVPPESLFENPCLDAVARYLHEHLDRARHGT